MISATEAQAMYVNPPFTQDEIEEQIRKAATSKNYTCFDALRFPLDLIEQMEAKGFRLVQSCGDVIVNW